MKLAWIPFNLQKIIYKIIYTINFVVYTLKYKKQNSLYWWGVCLWACRMTCFFLFWGDMPFVVLLLFCLMFCLRLCPLKLEHVFFLCACPLRETLPSYHLCKVSVWGRLFWSTRRSSGELVRTESQKSDYTKREFYPWPSVSIVNVLTIGLSTLSTYNGILIFSNYIQEKRTQPLIISIVTPSCNLISFCIPAIVKNYIFFLLELI